MDRWRLDEEHDFSTTTTRAKPNNNSDSCTWSAGSSEEAVTTTTTFRAKSNSIHSDSCISSEGEEAGCAVTASRRYEIIFPLSSDHLLTLIQYNTFRGLITNKLLLQRFAKYVLPGHHDHDHHDQEVLPCHSTYPGYSVILPFDHHHLPKHLVPTNSQMSSCHSTWIDLIPFPKMRDNLIKWAPWFDHSEFAADVIGSLGDTTLYPKRRRGGAKHSSPIVKQRFLVLQQQPDDDDDDDDESSGSGSTGTGLGQEDARNGLIVWGEPFLPSSWEVTPGFLRKWSWTVEGCDELMYFSNRWRMARGDEPMRLCIT